jgi:hypothetical protein
MKRYKVLTLKDKWLSGRFDAAALEEELNRLASLGWSVVTSVTASRAGVLTGGSKDEMIIILEQDTAPSRPRHELEAMIGSGPRPPAKPIHPPGASGSVATYEL